jgi:uncharacterized protein YndB with AHSA1/START domain
MTTETHDTTQRYEVEVAAAPATVWRALTTSEWTERYGYGGRVEYDPRPGGAYRLFATDEMIERGAPAVVVEGRVLEADAPRRLVVTWRALFATDLAAEPATRVTYETGPAGNGSTRLTVTHELAGAPATAALVGGQVPGAGGGWRFVVDDLKRAIEETGVALVA